MVNQVIVSTKEELITICRERGLRLYAAAGGEQVLGNTIGYGDKRIYLRTDVSLMAGSPPRMHRFLLIAKAGSLSNGLQPERSELLVPDDVLSQFNDALISEDDAIRRISTWPITRAFVCLDVSDFSTIPAGQQALVIGSICRLMTERRWIVPAMEPKGEPEAQLCIGDGYIYVWKEPVLATFFGARLAHLIDVSIATGTIPVEFHYRIGIHVGPVYCFWDPGRQNWNYVGDGINAATRILQAIGKHQDDVVFVSDRIRQCFLGGESASPLLVNADNHSLHDTIRDHMDNRGRRHDKHGLPWRVYELNHTLIGSAPETWGFEPTAGR